MGSAAAEQYDYDLITIGAGSGGTRASRYAWCTGAVQRCRRMKSMRIWTAYPPHPSRSVVRDMLVTGCSNCKLATLLAGGLRQTTAPRSPSSSCHSHSFQMTTMVALAARAQQSCPRLEPVRNPNACSQPLPRCSRQACSAGVSSEAACRRSSCGTHRHLRRSIGMLWGLAGTLTSQSSTSKR